MKSVHLAVIAGVLAVSGGCGGSLTGVSNDGQAGGGETVAVGSSEMAETTASSQVQPAFEDSDRFLALSDPDKRLRIEAISEHRAPGIEAISYAMTDMDPSVRMEAVEAVEGLSNLDAQGGAFDLLEDALADTDQAVREAGVEVLSALEGPRALGLLGVALADVSGLVREEAVAALAARDDHEAQALLASALADPDPVVRDAAFHALHSSD